MKKYNVIWFDDEFASLEDIKEKAMLNGINLFGFNNAKDGIEELARNIKQYDAAVVDGRFFKNPNQSGDVLNDKALVDVALALERFGDNKKLPWFILSGHASFTKDKNSFADAFKDNKVYDKLNDDDLIALWNDLKTEADQQADTQIRHKFQRVFESCTEKYIGVNASKDLLAILKKENTENIFADPDLYFNPLRKIMEDLFIASNKYGLLPDVFVKPNIALNESSKFLSGGIERGYQLVAAVYPKIVSDNVRSILSVCQPAVHRSEIDRFIKQVNSPYLLLSVTYQLLDVLLWFKSYVDSNSDVALNRSKFITVVDAMGPGLKTGKIEQDSQKNFYCGEYLLNFNFTSANYKVGDNIKIIEAIANTDKRTKITYPHFVTKYAIIQA